MNVFYYLFSKSYVDKKIREYLSCTYKKDDIIVVALHGIFEYYWQSFTMYLKYFDKQGRVIIPICHNYWKPHDEILKKITKDIQNIKDKTKATIVLVGNSDGALLGSQYMYATKGKLIKEFIPIAGPYEKTNGVAFWWNWIRPTSSSYLAKLYQRLQKEKPPKTKQALYASKDYFVLEGHRKLLSVKNIPFPTGHFGMLYNKQVIEYLYNYIFKT